MRTTPISPVARIALARKDLAGAILSFEQAIANNPANAAAHFELALIFYSEQWRKDRLRGCLLSFQPPYRPAAGLETRGQHRRFRQGLQKEIAKDIAMAPSRHPRSTPFIPCERS